MNQKQKRNQTSKIVLAGVLLVVMGVILPLVGFGLPSPLSTVGNIPYSPYIPEGYYSRGIIDYVNSDTGKYYLVVMPKSTKNVNFDRTVKSASIMFEDPAKTIDVPFKKKASVPEEVAAYEWSQFWYETDVVSDGLEFDKNYTVTWTVVDVWDRVDSVTDWLMFKELADDVQSSEMPFTPEEPNILHSIFNYVSIAGVAFVVVGVYLGRNKGRGGRKI